MQRLSKKLYVRVAGVLSVGLMLASISVPTVFSQQNQQAGLNLTTTPVVANVGVKPGASVSTNVQVKNNGLTTEHIRVGLLKFSSNNKDGSPNLAELDPTDEFRSWVKFSEDKFDAEPNVWKTIDVTISPPASAAFGYYYAVTFSRDNETTAQGSPGSLTASIAVPILLDVQAPGAIRKAEIQEFIVNKNVFEFLPAKFSVTLKNSGNTHVAPRGNIFISKGGKNLGVLEVNQGKGSILPNSTRQFTTEWSEGSPVYKFKEENDKVAIDKKGKQISSLDWSRFDFGKLRFGKYHAKAAMVYDDGSGDVSTEAELDFWVIPWRIIAFVVVGLLLIVAGLWAVLIRPVRSGIKKKLPSKKKFKVE